MIKRLLITIITLASLAAKAEIVEPVHFTTHMEMRGSDEAEIIFDGKIDKGWHVYSTNLDADGPIPATLNIVRLEGAELLGSLTPIGSEITNFDKMFGTNIRYFEDSVRFVQRIKFTSATYTIDCTLEYGACNAESCLPPSHVNFTRKGSLKTKPRTEAKQTEAKQTEPTPDPTPEATPLPDTLAPTTYLQPSNVADRTTTEAWQILLEGLLAGLIAILTPCVWPIIPLTVSYFLRAGRGVSKALLYGASIVVVYVSLGLVVTSLFSASTLNELSTGALFNIATCLLLVVFALSFLGAFEIQLPEALVNNVNKKRSTTKGLLGIFLMALLLCLTSFSCTGPIIGALLVAVSTHSHYLAPAIGMLGFSLSLAIVFTLFALFPSLLKRLPRSGGWMKTLKVTLAFVELALALKFLSVADMAYGWHILDREVFLALWITIFCLLGVYHLAFWLRLALEESEEVRVGTVQLLIAIASIAFAVYMIPGLWGAPLKAISAFTPPMTTQDFNLYKVEHKNNFTDYDQAIGEAQKTSRPLLVNFTGFGCVNCRKMEATLLADPQIADYIEDNFILVNLFVDDKEIMEHPLIVSEGGETLTLSSVGEKWSYLQRHKFGANSQPFFVIVDPDGRLLSSPLGFTEDSGKFWELLEHNR